MASTRADQSTPEFGAITREREVLEELRRLVDSDAYHDGDKLPPERQLAEEYQVSRRVLQSGFAVLEAEGKIWRDVGRGTFVGRRSTEPITDLARLARTSNPVAIIEARLSFEPAVARFAAQRASSSHSQEMQRINEEALSATSTTDFQRLDERFHKSMVGAAQNTVFDAIHDVISGVWTRLAWGASTERAYTAEWKRIYLRQHRVILEAIEGRELDRAEVLVLEHWQTMRVNLIRDPMRDRLPREHALDADGREM